jgi:hypothetical protein
VHIVNDNKNWTLLLKDSATKGFLALVSNWKTTLGPMNEKSWNTLL